MPRYRKLSVIIPAYNKDSEVFKAVSSYVNTLKTVSYDWEIIVVDDASSDNTLREAVRSKHFNGNTEKIRIFSYDLNQGKGFALYHGFKKSSGDVIAFADADLDLPSSNLPVLLKEFEKGESSIVVGSKRHPDSNVHYPVSRRILSFGYHMLVKAFFDLNISDTQVGLKIFKREVLEKSMPRIVVKKFAFDLELLVVAKTQNFDKITEAPITLKYNFSSSVNMGSVLNVLQDTAAIFYRKNFLKYYVEPKNMLEFTNGSLSKFREALI